MTTVERLYHLAADFAEAVGSVERWEARADSAIDSATDTADPVTGADRADPAYMAKSWRALVARRREELRAALREALRGTVRAVPDDELPVATWHQGRVEIRAVTTDGARTVRVRYTPAQALAAGAALIACAAITDQRAGGTLADILTAFPPNPSTEPDTEQGAEQGAEPGEGRPTGASTDGPDAATGDPRRGTENL